MNGINTAVLGAAGIHARPIGVPAAELCAAPVFAMSITARLRRSRSWMIPVSDALPAATDVTAAHLAEVAPPAAAIDTAAARAPQRFPVQIRSHRGH